MDAAARDANRLETIMELIDSIERRLKDIDAGQFADDMDEIDLTAFRLAHIGENANKLSESIKTAHLELPWRQTAAMRNLIAHEYHRIDPALIYRTATTRLVELRAVCGLELKRL